MKDRKKRTERLLLWAFFSMMVVFTAVSRIYDSVTVPKVLTTLVKRKGVETVIEGTGTVTVKERMYYVPLSGLRIADAPLEPGSEVEEGQVLFRYDLDSVREKKEELEGELQQIQINIEKEQAAQADIPEITQTELAFREWILAGKELEEGEFKLEEAKKEYEREREELDLEFESGMDQIEEELWQQQDEDLESARQRLESVKTSRDRELREAQREIEDLTEELDSLSEEDGKTYRETERKLERAQEDLEDLKDSWGDQIDSAKLQIEALESKEEWIRSGKTSAQEARRKTYEDEIKQQEEILKAAEEEKKKLEKAVEEARWQVETAQKQDETARLTGDQKKRIAALTVRGMELEKEKTRRQINRLEDILAHDGEVRASGKGTVAEMELVPGRTATGEERLSLATGDRLFEGTFMKEEQELAKGDKIEIAIPGTEKKKEGVIGNINLMGETEGVFQAGLSGEELPFGSLCRFTCRKQSDIFTKVIPISGLRKDMEGYYCLVARPRSSILGEEYRAERVNVEVVYLGSREAAIEGAVSGDDGVIAGENRSIGNGDRVRPVSGF